MVYFQPKENIINLMSSNFQFLKKINNNLFEIIAEAEKLYRDEYFEQCMVQTRRFGEHICKSLMTQNNRETGSFDDMLATLKDQMHGHTQEKEFIDDLYFLKKNGNQSVHSGKIKKDGMTALECLKRSFEVAINYSVYAQGASSDILKLNYDVELLITNKKSKPSLTQKYEEAKTKQKTEITKPQKVKQSENQNKSTKIHQNIKLSWFWKSVLFTSIISVFIILFLIIIINLR